MDVLLSWPGGSWQTSAQLFGGLMVAYLLIMWLASVLWVYRDIRSRTTDPTSHLVSVAIAVIFPIVGLPIYLVLRPSDTMTAAYDRQLEQEALLSELQAVSACPSCRRPVQDDFAVCAFCAAPVKHGCGRCGRQLRLAWRFCPYCATPRALPQQSAIDPRYGAPAAGNPGAGSSGGVGARITASREAAVEAIRRAARTQPDTDPDDDDAPRSRRPQGDPGAPPRPRRPRPEDR